MVRPLDFASYDQRLNLFQVVPGSTPCQHLYKAKRSLSCQLGFFKTRSINFLYSVDICIDVLHQPMDANYQTTYQIIYYYHP